MTGCGHRLGIGAGTRPPRCQKRGVRMSAAEVLVLGILGLVLGVIGILALVAIFALAIGKGMSAFAKVTRQSAEIKVK
jgi:hypothetical protein